MIIARYWDFKKNPLRHKRRLEWSKWDDLLVNILTAKDDYRFVFYLNVFRINKRLFVIFEIGFWGWMISAIYGREC
ncbi:hypothetical protein IH992_04095 [Candidatus Poribacteria bacterium]|nr:hypothetical protein [Candidatus Poribacteria bacterium]